MLCTDSRHSVPQQTSPKTEQSLFHSVDGVFFVNIVLVCLPKSSFQRALSQKQCGWSGISLKPRCSFLCLFYEWSLLRSTFIHTVMCRETGHCCDVKGQLISVSKKFLSPFKITFLSLWAQLCFDHMRTMGHLVCHNFHNIC